MTKPEKEGSTIRAVESKADRNRLSVRQHDATSFARFCLFQSSLSSDAGASGQVSELLRRAELSINTKFMRLISLNSLWLITPINRQHEKELRHAVSGARLSEPRPTLTLLYDSCSRLFRLGYHNHLCYRHERREMEEEERMTDASECRLFCFLDLFFNRREK